MERRLIRAEHGVRPTACGGEDLFRRESERSTDLAEGH